MSMKVLTNAGHEVLGLDTGYFAASSSTGFVRKDVRDLTPADLAGVNAVVHLAALSNDPLGELQADWTHQINCLGSLHLARIARDAGVSRFLFSSSVQHLRRIRQRVRHRGPRSLEPLSAFTLFRK